jgi:ABC-type transporter Mla subunit MlaD
MRTREKDQKNFTKVGIFISVLTIIVMIIVASIGKESSIFESKITLKARVPNVSNLKVGSYVELKGIRIGTVTDIFIASDDEVEISMKILNKELRWIKKDSKITISNAGLVGDKYVEIYKGSKEAGAFNPNQDVLLSEEVTDLRKIMNQGDAIAKLTENVLFKLDNILIQIGDGQKIIETFNSMNKSASHMEQITTELKRAQLGEVVNNLNRASSSLDRVLNQVENGPGTMHSLIYDESVHDDMRSVLGGAQRNKTIKYFIRESIKKSEARKPQED